MYILIYTPSPLFFDLPSNKPTMGTGFMAASKRWALPIQSPPLPATGQQHHLQRPTSLRGRESSVESRLSPLVTLEEGELLYRDSLGAYACSSRALGSIENTFTNANDTKGNTDKKYIGSFKNLNRPSRMLEDDSTYLATLTPSNSLQFSLLIENLDKIADIFAVKDLVSLERDILVHIERLGALRVFHASLSRTLMAPTVLTPKNQLTEHSRDCPVDYSISEQRDKTIVRSSKKEQRKQRRTRASDKLNFLSVPLRKIHKVEDPAVSFPTRWNGAMASSKLKRVAVARNESQMSMGVKELADLHRTRTKLEEQIGRAASYARWAEQAGLDQKTLQQRLQYGWYCRDQLIKSTHSLVVYLARNYRGVGIAFDDLLQAGTIGVLKGAERFDNTRGYRFSTYVQYWIRKSMLALVARHSKGIQIPVKMQKIIKQTQKARITFYNEVGRYPKDEETADITGLSLATVKLANKSSRVIGSLDQEIRGGWCTKFMEVIPDTTVKAPEESITRQHMKKDISKLLAGLHPKERLVLELRYGLDDGRCKSLEEVGRRLLVTKEWIRQLQKTALTKLRRDDIQRELEYYLH